MPAEILKLMIKYLGLENQFTFVKKYQPRIPLVTRKCVWDFWHLVSDPSTLTTSLASLCVSDKPGIQEELAFADTVKEKTKRNRKYYESIWRTLSVPVLELWAKCCKENSDHKVSSGTFLNLKLFYVRTASRKDMEMCVCKVHLHTRTCISAIVIIANKLEIDIPFTCYKTFFEMLYVHCNKGDQTYIAWECTSDKKTVCNHIEARFSELVKNLTSVDEQVTVTFTHFERQISFDPATGEIIKNKKGEPVKRLVAVKEKASAQYLVNYLSNLLPEIVYHRNLLRLLRNVKSTFINSYNCAYIDVDFSENLTIG